MNKNIKRTIFAFVSIFLASQITFAQEPLYVSTIPSNANLVIEDFTGFKCPNCPDAHSKINQIARQFPDRIFPINVHAGSFASPSGVPSGAQSYDFRTPQGDALVQFMPPGGYPAATFNRDSISKTYRNLWGEYATAHLNTFSYLNVGGIVFIDTVKRKIEVEIEVLYTGDPDTTCNFLTVALLQDNIVAYQSGTVLNTEQEIEKDKAYNHMHVLRGYLTPTWGDKIEDISKGSLYTFKYAKTYAKKIKDIPLDLQNVEVIAFVAKSKKDIISGIRPKIQYIELVDNEEELTANNVDIYAVSKTIKIETIEDILGKDVFVYDALGRLVKKSRLSTSSLEIQVQNPGLYLVKLGSYTKKLVIK